MKVRGKTTKSSWLCGLTAPVVVLGLASAVFCADFQNAVAQSQPQIVTAAVANGEFKLSWSGSSASYQVQSTTNLGAANWNSTLTTAGTNAQFSLSGNAMFFRVVGAGGSGGQSITAARRLQILDEINQKIDSLSGTNADADNQELARFLSGYSELRDISISTDSCIWAEFTDGRLLTLVGNRGSSDTLTNELTALPAWPQAASSAGIARGSVPLSKLGGVPLSLATAPPVLGIPKSSKAYLLTHPALGMDLSHPINWQAAPEMKTWFADYGYQVVQQDATLDALASVQNAGVFYYEGHSAFREDKQKFILVTATTIDEPISPGFSNDVHYAIILRPRPNRRNYYAVTPDFVQKYMRFSDNSFVLINSCSAAAANATVLVQAFFNPPVQASAFAGWTDSVQDSSAWRAARYLFDRLLGANQAFDPVRSPDFAETPPQRSFAYPDVLLDMQNRNLNQSQAPGHPTAQLVVIPNAQAPTRFGILAPSIEAIRVDEANEKLHIFGIFDPTSSASVVVSDGQTLAVNAADSVSTSEIVSSLPAAGPPSAGQVWVYQGAQQARSNKVPLTEWRLKVQGVRYFAGDQPQPSATFNFEIHFRADVHRTRLAPHQQPVRLLTTTDAARDSTCTLVDASGIYSVPALNYSVQWALPSPVVLPIIYGGVGDLSFSGNATFYTNGPVDMFFSANAANKIVVTETNNGQQTMYASNPDTRTVPPSRAFLDPNTYAIQGGSGSAAGDSGQFTWGTTGAAFAPDESAPGYAAEYVPGPVSNLK
jgi:hypothetical protein